MTSNGLSSIERKFSSITSYLIGSIRISCTKDQRADYNTVVAGLTLWYGVVLDYNSMFCSADRASATRGRILKHALDGWPREEAPLQEFLSSLDELGDISLRLLSSYGQFKADHLRKELATWKVSTWLCPLKGILLSILCSGLSGGTEGDEVRVARALRVISCFLKKLDVARPDLECQMREEFKDFENSLQSDVPKRSIHPEYQMLVLSMRKMLSLHMDEFDDSVIVPGHGPGAVANTRVKDWYAKHTSSHSDSRVGYLLDHAHLGNQSDYLPFVKVDKSTRTSRYICVPKTWKKLRGISCEPAELQFWQQAVLKRLDAMFRHDKWWRMRVDLHDQDRSRRLALQGSVDGSLATVDLSAASDSVTLQLVRDVFGNSKIARWLLGTRSTHTLCGDITIRINKFAPMGSACCFPVECMIFCLAAEVAVSRTRTSYSKRAEVCVYGDDIIVPSYAAQELLSILSLLGFSVNTEKSFWDGYFREACGIEAWRGHDVAPCRFKAWKSGIVTRDSSYEEIAGLTSFANELFERGLHGTREFLLENLFKKGIHLGKSRVFPVQNTIPFSFSGECGTLASPYPTNFNLEKKFSRSLWTNVYKRVVWQERVQTKPDRSFNMEDLDTCKYVSWLVDHQVDDRQSVSGTEEILDILARKGKYDRVPLGIMMVPTVKWVLPSTTNSL